MRVLIDTNVILDVLQSREPWHKEGQTIFLAVANHVMTGCITAKQAADIHFFSRKQFVGQENTDEKARKILAGIFSLFEVFDSLAEDSLNAMGITNGDYEDVMMIETACPFRCGLHYHEKYDPFYSGKSAGIHSG